MSFCPAASLTSRHSFIEICVIQKFPVLFMASLKTQLAFNDFFYRIAGRTHVSLNNSIEIKNVKFCMQSSLRRRRPKKYPFS
jgi:hypothetical protein